MPKFSTSWANIDELPDSHLILTRWTSVPSGIRAEQLIVASHVHPDLLRDLDEYFRHLSNTQAFELRPELAAAEPEFRTQYELVDPALLPLGTFGVKVSRDRKYYTFCVRRDTMSEALVREINTDLGSGPRSTVHSPWRPTDLATTSRESSRHRTAA
jgi:hypothetical protein